MSLKTAKVASPFQLRSFTAQTRDILALCLAGGEDFINRFGDGDTF